MLVRRSQVDHFTAMCGRACIGQRFARLELQLLLAKLVQRYRLDYTGPEISFITRFVSVPDQPVNIKLTPR